MVEQDQVQRLPLFSEAESVVARGVRLHRLVSVVFLSLLVVPALAMVGFYFQGRADADFLKRTAVDTANSETARALAPVVDEMKALQGQVRSIESREPVAGNAKAEGPRPADDLRAAVATLAQRQASLEQRLQGATNAPAGSTTTDVQQSLAALGSRQSALESALSALAADRNREGRQSETIDQKLGELSQSRESMEASLADARRADTALTDRIRTLEEALAALRAEVQDLREHAVQTQRGR